MRCSISLFAALAASALVDAPGCDLLRLLDDGVGGPPPPTLPPGTPLDDDVLPVADGSRVTSDDPVEVVRDAVQTANLYSGFGIRDDDAVVIDDSRSRGITFERWDVDTMADGFVAGVAVTLDDYAGARADLAGATDVDNFKQALLDDIATAASSDAPGPRAWAQLIVARRPKAVPIDTADMDNGTPVVDARDTAGAGWVFTVTVVQ